MKVKEIRLMSELDIANKSAELKKELMKINSQIAIGTLPKSPGKIKEIRRTIAKMLTIKNDKSKFKQNKGSKDKEEAKRNE